jgi:crossover junction endodeoxyribonuclease RuvC
MTDVSKVIIGIDPGIVGGVAILDSDHVIDSFDMPVMASGVRTKRKVNAASLAEKLKAFHPNIKLALIERVSAMPKQGVSSSFSFGEAYGAAQGVIQGLGIPLMFVTPREWKKYFGLIKKDKDFSRTVAQEHFPDVDLSLKKDVHRAEALLIAKYGLERMADCSS